MNIGKIVCIACGLICCACLCPADVVFVSSSNFSDFVSRAANEDNFNYDVVLTEDIDASELELPLGRKPYTSTCHRYSGTFDGGNHRINGAVITSPTSSAGLFCGMKNATVKNLIISETCSFSSELTVLVHY